MPYRLVENALQNGMDMLRLDDELILFSLFIILWLIFYI